MARTVNSARPCRADMVSGFTLIEVLISLFILSLMLLGLDVMQMLALRQAKTAYYFSVATAQLNAMSQRLQVWQQQSLDQTFIHWNQQNQVLLPQGRGQITGSYPDYILTISWGQQGDTVCQENRIGQSGCLRYAFKESSG